MSGACGVSECRGTVYFLAYVVHVHTCVLRACMSVVRYVDACGVRAGVQ